LGKEKLEKLGGGEALIKSFMNLSVIFFRDLLDQVRRLEEKELSSQSIERPSFEALQPQKRLAPLNEGGPMQLLHLQVRKAYFIYSRISRPA